MTYRSATGASSSSTSSLSVNVPASVADDDGMIAQVTWLGTSTLTAPGGWTQTGTEQSYGNKKVRYYTRIASSEPASYSWGVSPAERIVVNVLAFYDIDTSAFVNASDTASTGSSATVTAVGVTPSVDGCDLVAFFAASGNTSFTQAAGMTEREDRNIGGFNLAGAADTEAWTSGATGNRTSTITSSDWAGALFALAPTPTPSPVSLLLAFP